MSKKAPLSKPRAIFLLFSLIFFGLFLTRSANAQLPSEIQDIINSNRPQYDQLSEEQQREKFEEYLYCFQSLTEPDLEDLAPSGHVGEEVSVEQALADTDFLFSAFKYCYAGYSYFGGDQRFDQTLQKIKRQLEEDWGPSVPVDELEKLLCGELKFINDGHLIIETNILMQKAVLFMNSDYIFLKDETGYYLPGAKREYLTEIDGLPPDSFMLPSLDDKGNVIFRIGVLETDLRFTVTVTALLQSEQDVRELTLPLTIMLPEIMDGEIYEKFEVDDIPVVAIKEFPFHGPRAETFDPHKDQVMQDFFADAFDLQAEPAIVLDLRNNVGGDYTQGISWLRNLTGLHILGPPSFQTSLQTKTSLYFENLVNLERGRHQQWHSLRRPRQSGWSEIIITPIQDFQNERLIVVLIDMITGSGGELLIDTLRQLPNVVFLGTNTFGAYNFINPVYFQLPATKLQVLMPIVIQMPFDLEFLEGVGFLPDFWVPPADALDIAISFIERYGTPQRE